ncbi:hypothetical protein ACJ41O_014334 [Fusarium nematophilum]
MAREPRNLGKRRSGSDRDYNGSERSSGFAPSEAPVFTVTRPKEPCFSDIGCYGAEIQTPNIDRLASEGIRMLNHHAAAACSPTRAMLLSGTDAHLGGLGVLVDVATIPEVLQDNNYFTAMSGKERFPVHAEKGKNIDMTPNKTEDPDGFYSTDYYTNRLIEYLQDRSEDDKSKPFFAFVPYTAPHCPLQYKGMYDDGPYALRERRLKRLVELGIIKASAAPHQVETETMGVGERDDLTPEAKKLSSRAMEAYAGMVDSIDFNVGKVIDFLKKTGEYENTFVVFMSDNGAKGAIIEAVPVMGDNITHAIHQYYDNSYDNIGSWNSFTWLGPFWPQASTAPSRLFKCFPSQGGILVPCVVKPPADTFLPSFTPGSFNRSFSTIMDFAPTFLELAGVSLPPASEKTTATELGKGSATVKHNKTSFRGKDVHAIRGKSWVPHFGRGGKVEDNEMWAIHSCDEPVGWELFAR